MDEEWPVQRLEAFAAAYFQHEILYMKPLPMKLTTSTVEQRLAPMHQEFSKEFALGRLAGTLGLPNDHALGDRCLEFRYQLFCYIRSRVRSTALRGGNYVNALDDAPIRIAQLANKLDLLRAAVLAELSCRGSPVQRWAVLALIQALSLRARRFCNVTNSELDAIAPDVLSIASAAVTKNIKPVPKDLWLRLCALRKRQLLKLTLAGDRSAALRPSERFERADWELVDTLLLYASDDDITLETEMLIHWCDSLRALVMLVELVLATRVRLRAPPEPPRRLAAVWKSVLKTYTTSGRSATAVLLQRRWQRLLQMAHGLPQPVHPLLVLVASSFPRLMRKTGHSWRTLVRNGLVATTEDVNKASVGDELTLNIDFLELESCKTTKDIEKYVENKLQRKHNMYYNGTFWKKIDDTQTVVVDLSNCSDSDLDDECIFGQNITDKNNKDNKVDDLNDPALKIIEEGVDVEKQNKPDNKPAGNCQKYIEIVEIGKSKIDDYISDVLMEVESLKTLDDLEKGLEDLDNLNTFEFMKQSNKKSEIIKFVDGDGTTHHITTSNSGKLVFSPASAATMDPKLVRTPRVKLNRFDDTRAWRRYAINNRIDVKHSGVLDIDDRPQSAQTVQLPEVTYISDSSTDSERDIFPTDEDIHGRKPRNQDSNRNSTWGSKRRSSRFLRNPKNRKLLELCKPVTVRLHRMRESELPRRGRAVKKVELADIEEVRRINRNILTAQVEPTYVHRHSSKVAAGLRADALARQARELALTPLADDIDHVDAELRKLFLLPPKKLENMIIRAIYGDEFDKTDAKGKHDNRHWNHWLRRKEDMEARAAAPAAGPPPSEENQQQKKITNKHPEMGAKRAATKLHGDLDDMLRCSIIRRPCPYAGESETQPYFVSSDEGLLARDCPATPVITGVRSLAGTRTTGPTANPIRSDPLQEAVRRLRRPARYGSRKRKRTSEKKRLVSDGAKRAVGGVVHLNNDRVTAVPSDSTVGMESTKKRRDASQNSKFVLSKQYERFGGARTDLAALTPVAAGDAPAPTIALVHARAAAAPQPAVVTASPLATRLVPTVVNNNPLLVATLMTPQPSAVQTFALSQVAGAHALQLVPAFTTKAPRALPALTLAPQLVVADAAALVPTVTVLTPASAASASRVVSAMPVTSPMSVLPGLRHGLLSMSADINVVGIKDKPNGDAVTLDTLRDGGKWQEPGRIEPPSALTFNHYLTPKEYISKFGTDLTIVKLDSSRPLWTVAEEYMILAEKILPCKEPSYWTLGSPANCTQLIWPRGKGNKRCDATIKKVKCAGVNASASSIVIEAVGGNCPKPDASRGFIESIYLSNSDSDDVEIAFGDGQSGRRAPSGSKLKVKSFAKCKRMEKNILDGAATRHPDVMERFDRYFKKLTDEPVRYSLMLTAVASTEECDGLLRERAALHVWDRRSGALRPLDVTAPARDQLPERMAGALLVRHADSRFLKDMAGKFQRLNSAHALVRENQVYVFAPETGTLLVAPPD